VIHLVGKNTVTSNHEVSISIYIDIVKKNLKMIKFWKMLTINTQNTMINLKKNCMQNKKKTINKDACMLEVIDTCMLEVIDTCMLEVIRLSITCTKNFKVSEMWKLGIYRESYSICKW